jgi:hypothetical protein
MKISVAQLKQLIREQVEEMAARRGRGVEAEEPDLSSPFAQDVMLASLGSETPAGEDVEFVEEEWADWIRDNEKELKQVLRTKYNVKKMDLATALKKGKKAFFKKASYDPDFMGRAVKIRGLFPEFEEYYINRRKRLGY